MGNKYYLVPNDELYHYGVLGMKWGVRRYQNKDGSLTDAGKRRYFRITNQENIAKASIQGADNRKRIMAEYESKKTAAQKQADQNSQKAWDDYQKYIEDYSKSNKDTQIRYEHDYDHTKKGKRLLKAITTADEVRQKAYAGAEWYAKYAKEMDRAADKDYAPLYRAWAMD